MAINLTLAETSASVGTIPAFPGFVGPDDQSSSSTARVSAKTDTAGGVYTKYTHEYVDFAGNVLTVGAPATNFVRYCEYPGTRIIQNVKFEVNGNELDTYTYDATLFHQKFNVQPNKMIGWKRLVGQEVPVTAYSDFLSVSGASNYGAAVANLKDTTTASVLSAPINAARTSRKVFQIVHGPQTPKAVQPALNLICPVLLWFCKDVRVAIPSVCLPYGQRLLHVTLAPQNHILYTAPGNLFLRLTVEKTTSAGTGKGTAAAVDVTLCETFVSQKAVLASGSVIDANQRITNASLYNNQLFVNPEMEKISRKRCAFQQWNSTIASYPICA